MFFLRRGMTLVEILIAGAIFVGFMLPVLGLLSMGGKGAEYADSWAVAMDIGQNIMDRLISDEVPFVAIEPEAYGSGTLANGHLRQADFRDSFGTESFADLKLKSILGADAGGNYEKSIGSFGGEDRVIKVRGYRYRVLLWAGIYNHPTSPEPSGASTVEKLRNNADPNQVMTYIYYPSPWFDLHNDCAFSLSAKISGISGSSSCDSLSGGSVSRGRPINPYSQKHGGESGTYYFNNVPYTDPPRAAFRHGYPAASSAAAEAHLRMEDKAFHNRVDINSDGLDDGGFMKLILGVVWEPGLTIDGKERSAGTVSTQQIQEFYLVSFKANLSH